MARSSQDGGAGPGPVRRRRSAPSPPELRLAAQEAQGATNATDAEAVLSPLRHPAGPAISVKAACAQFVESKQVRRPETRTAGNYRSVLRYLVDYLDAHGKGADVWAVSADDIEDWLRELQTTPAGNRYGSSRLRSPYTIANYARHVAVCWHALAARGLVPAHVAAAITVPAIPRSQRVQPRTFTDGDVAALFAACAEGEMGSERDALTVRNQALLAVLLDSGVRVGELCSMRVERIDWDRRAASVLHSKTEVRVVSIGGDQTAQRLRRYVQKARPWLALDVGTGATIPHDEDGDITADTGALWLSRDGWQLTDQGVGELLVRLKRRSGISGPCSPHVCRRYYITRAIQRGVPIVEIARQCGVSPEVIYRHYFSGTEDESLRAVRQGSPLDALESERRRAQSRPGPKGGRRGRGHGQGQRERGPNRETGE